MKCSVSSKSWLCYTKREKGHEIKTSPDMTLMIVCSPAADMYINHSANLQMTSL